MERVSWSLLLKRVLDVDGLKCSTYQAPMVEPGSRLMVGQSCCPGCLIAPLLTEPDSTESREVEACLRQFAEFSLFLQPQAAADSSSSLNDHVNAG